MTTSELAVALTEILNDFLIAKENDSGYNLEVDTAQQLRTIMAGYPWS